MTGDQVWETSASMEKLKNAKPLFEVITRPSYFAHYRNETSAFFLTREFTEEIKLNSQFARHLVLAGTDYGDGRVVLFTDSTDFNNGIVGFGNHGPLFLAMVEYVSQEEKYSKVFVPFLLLIVALAVVYINRRNAFNALVVLSILLLLSFNLSYPLTHYTTQFPELKGEPQIAILEADQHYMEEYLSGMYDMEKLMDKYFHQNLTALIMVDPSEEWIGISSKGAPEGCHYGLKAGLIFPIYSFLMRQPAAISPPAFHFFQIKHAGSSGSVATLHMLNHQSLFSMAR
jgi:hypothetical protein